MVKDWVEKKVRRHLMRARKRKGFGQMCSHLATERAGLGTLHLTVGASELYQPPLRANIGETLFVP